MVFTIYENNHNEIVIEGTSYIDDTIVIPKEKFDDFIKGLLKFKETFETQEIH
jgi:hypothetical protein